LGNISGGFRACTSFIESGSTLVIATATVSPVSVSLRAPKLTAKRRAGSTWRPGWKQATASL